jgi:hypothetical protein
MALTLGERLPRATKHSRAVPTPPASVGSFLMVKILVGIAQKSPQTRGIARAGRHPRDAADARGFSRPRRWRATPYGDTIHVVTRL